MEKGDFTIKTEACMMDIGNLTKCTGKVNSITDQALLRMMGCGTMINLKAKGNYIIKLLKPSYQPMTITISTMWTNSGNITKVTTFLFR